MTPALRGRAQNVVDNKDRKNHDEIVDQLEQEIQGKGLVKQYLQALAIESEMLDGYTRSQLARLPLKQRAKAFLEVVKE